MPASPATYYRATTPDGWVIRPHLTTDISVEVCVIGAGFAGLNTALELLEKGVNSVAVLESGEIGQGASGRNGGFVFGGYSLGEAALLRTAGPENARALYALTRDAVATIRARAKSSTMDCQMTDAGVVWANWFRSNASLTERRDLVAREFDVHWEHLNPEQLRRYVRSGRYSDGMLERDAFHFHPLRYAASLAARIEDLGGTVHTHSAVKSLKRDGDRWDITTANGTTVNCTHVVLCGGGYLRNVWSPAEQSMMPISTYVMVTEPLGDALDAAIPCNAAVYDSRFAFDYYRKLPDKRLLWGGRITVKDPPRRIIESRLRADLKRVFPQFSGARVDYAWSGLMSYATHQMPQLGNPQKGLWIAQAFGGHGVATTTVAGRVIAAAICRDRKLLDLFARYGMSNVRKPMGLVAAQIGYWAAQTADALRK